jgi:hypothetical protein
MLGLVPTDCPPTWSSTNALSKAQQLLCPVQPGLAGFLDCMSLSIRHSYTDVVIAGARLHNTVVIDDPVRPYIH